MAKGTNAHHRMCRRSGVKLCTSLKCPLTRRKSPPGVHGPKGYPRLTAYGAQLMEKQKAKHMYGLRERQFAGLVGKAQKKTGDTGKYVIDMLESRLDNVVYRLGFASTRPHARQLVTHGHFEVDGRKLTIPSALLKVGQKITIKELSKKKSAFATLEDRFKRIQVPAWLTLDTASCVGTVTNTPTSVVEFMPLFDVKAVVEYYGR